MIRANVRSRLDAEDLRLVVRLLAGDSGRSGATLEARLATEGPDALLDDPHLAPRLCEARSLLVPSPALFVYVVVRQHLLQAGFASRDLADYLAALILDFARPDRARRISTSHPTRHDYLVDLLATLAGSEGEERFLVLSHMGNYSLWLGGLFPDRIAARHARRGGPDLSYYDRLGRGGFAAASDHHQAASAGLQVVYRTAAERFPALRASLNRLSDRLIFPHVRTDDRLLRDVARGLQ